MPIWSSEIKELEKLYESFKGQLPDLEKELERLIKADDENMILLYSRRCLEVIITDLCECELKRPRKTEPLQGIIDKLHKEEKVPSHIISSMHGLNELSTFGTHPKDFDPEQVKPVLNNLDIIIKWYLKYKETGTDVKVKPDEGIKHEIKSTGDVKKDITISRKKLAGIIGGSIGVIASVFAVLYFSSIIGSSKQTKEPEKSIAVLPFHNYSGDPAQEYMCNGLTDEIIGHLYKIKSFDKVVSLNSVLTYKETDKRLPRIAEELKVNYILEGTYKKIGDQIRVTAQLIEPKKDRHIWQNEYDLPYKEIITIQADIALKIADHLKAFLTSFEEQNIKKIPTTSQEAYQLIQQALNLLNTSTYKSYDQLYDLSLRAIELDPGYADAYALAGNMLFAKGSLFGDVAMQTVIWDAVKLWDKALELDQNNASAHCGLAMFNEFIKWDYIKAEDEILKAFELSPNSQIFMRVYSESLIRRNRLEDAIVYRKKGGSDPIRIEILSCLLSGKKDEAYKYMNTYLQSAGEGAHPWAGEYFLWLEDYEAAKSSLEAAAQKEYQVMLKPKLQACLALAFYKTNDHQRARVIIDQLIEKSNISLAGSPDYYTGWYYSGIGNIDSAFYWLEKAYKNRSPEIPWLKVDPVFKNIKGDPRYQDLYVRTGHKAYDDYRANLKK